MFFENATCFTYICCMKQRLQLQKQKWQSTGILASRIFKNDFHTDVTQ